MQTDETRQELLSPYAAPVATEPEVSESPAIAPPKVAPPEISFADFHPFRTIWFHPRLTVRQIIALNPKLHVMMLVALFGVVVTLNQAEFWRMGDHLSTLELLGWILVIGPIYGLVNLWAISHLIHFTRLWFRGTGTREHLKTAIAWSYIPLICTLPLWVFKLLLLDSQIFTSESDLGKVDAATFAVLMAMQLIQSTLGIWVSIVLCNAVTEVQGYQRRWRGFANAISANVLLGLLIGLGVLLFLLLQHLYE